MKGQWISAVACLPIRLAFAVRATTIFITRLTQVWRQRLQQQQQQQRASRGLTCNSQVMSSIHNSSSNNTNIPWVWLKNIFVANKNFKHLIQVERRTLRQFVPWQPAPKFLIDLPNPTKQGYLGASCRGRVVGERIVSGRVDVVPKKTLLKLSIFIFVADCSLLFQLRGCGFDPPSFFSLDLVPVIACYLKYFVIIAAAATAATTAPPSAPFRLHESSRRPPVQLPLVCQPGTIRPSALQPPSHQ